ncbi:urease accessory protein UreE [bacterium BMS3Bbin06]|nr:urease accessory protein UreE [bacterium BMS3Bbin06]
MIVIFPENTMRSAMIAYEIGNRHLPISLEGSNIVTPYDRFIEEFLRMESINYERRREAFEPMRRGDHHG